MPRRFGRWPIAALLLCLLAAALPCRPAAADAGAEICERAILAGARAVGVPQEVLHAISLTETGRPEGGRLRPWPWAINREGQGHWFRSRAEAFAFAQASLAAGRDSFDVGCFQINYHWHGHNFPSLEAMFDPETGATYAARFLRASISSAAAGSPPPAPTTRRHRRVPASTAPASSASSPASAATPTSRSPRRARPRPPRPRRRARAAPGSRAARRSSPSRRNRRRPRPAAPPRRA